jgi:tetratricopeptide (TPR) repeat protein
MRGAPWGWLVLMCMSAAFAGDKFEIGAPPEWVKEAAIAPGNDASDDAPIKILLADWQFHLGSPGAEGYFHVMTRAQTPQGLDFLATVPVPWNPATDSLTIHKLHILRDDKTIDVLADGQSFTVLRRENSLEFATLNGILTAVIQPAGLQVGDTLDLAFTIKRADPVLPAVSEWIATGWPNLPISHIRLRGQWEDSAGVRWQASEAMRGMKETHHGGVTEVAGSFDNVAPLSAMTTAPPRYSIGRQVQFSNVKSWTQIADLMAPLYAQAAKLTPQSSLNAEVERIRASTTDPGARAMAALALVQDKVHYVLLAMNEGALVPADADTTWTRRFGDCKGKTALLLALLHALDIEAVPVLVNTFHGDSVKSGLPLVEAFNHVLVRAVIASKVYWLDGTGSGDRDLDGLFTPPYYWGLPLVARADLEQIVPSPPNRPLIEIHVDIDASKGVEKSVPMHGQVVFRGPGAALMRLGFGSTNASKRDEAIREVWSNVFSFGAIDTVAARFDEQAAEEVLTMDGSIMLPWSEGHYEVAAFSQMFNGDFKRGDGEAKDAPFRLGFPAYGRMIETIKLPHAQTPFTIEGGDFNRNLVGIEIRRQAHVAGDTFTAEVSVRTLAAEVPASEVESEREQLGKVWVPALYLQAPATLLRTPGPSTTAVVPPLLPGVTPYDNPTARMDQLFDKDKAHRLIDEGSQALDRKDYSQAVSRFDSALELNPRSARALAGRGMAYVWQGMNDRASDDFAAASAIDAREPVIERGRGLMSFLAFNMAEAITHFTTAIEEEPQNPFALYYRARAYRVLGKLDQALADVDRAIVLRPEGVDYFIFRASLKRQRGELDESLKDADAVVAAGPNDPKAYLAAAEIDVNSGRTAEAMGALDKALALKPSVQGYVRRAACRPKSDVEGKRADLRAALALEPKSVTALLALAEVQSDAKEYADAAETVDMAIQAHGGSPELLADRSALYFKAGRQDLAEKDLNAARSMAKTATELNNICWTLATGDVAMDVALSSCDSAVALNLKEPHAHDSRGFVLLKLGRYSESIAEYDTALKALPELSMALYGRGLAKRRKGDKAAGDADIKSAIAIDARVGARFANYGLSP